MSDDTVAITDVDCTPRPRYGESRSAFEARMAGYTREVEVLSADVRVRNRRTALRSGTWPDGATYYFTQCACGWHGLREADPEVARREYDAHACRAEGVAQDAVDRAQTHVGKATMPAKRKAAVLQPAMAESLYYGIERTEADERRLSGVTLERDDTEQRVALLELDKL